MSNKERKFSGLIANGFMMLTVNLLVIAGCIAMAVLTTDTDGNPDGVCISLAVILTIAPFSISRASCNLSLTRPW